MPTIKVTLGDLLRQRNMTQTKLVELTGIRSQAISNLTRNKVERITLEHLTKIMTALELADIGELLKYVPPADTQSIESEAIEASDEDPLDEPIEMLDLSPRAFNAVKRIPMVNIVTVRDLLHFDFSDSRRFKTAKIGAVTLKEIKEALEHYVKKHK